MAPERLSEAKLRVLAGERGFDAALMEKDYVLTVLLYLLRDVPSLVFKGGTCLNKIVYPYRRLSEDLDYTVTGDFDAALAAVRHVLDENGEWFPAYRHDKSVRDYTRYVVTYSSVFGEGRVLLDLNGRASVLRPVVAEAVPHPYPLPAFRVRMLSRSELFAEKFAAMVARNKPRDYFDIATILDSGETLDFSLIEEKLGKAVDLDRVFANATKVFNSWEADLAGLTSDARSFRAVIDDLKERLGYAAHKAARRKN